MSHMTLKIIVCALILISAIMGNIFRKRLNQDRSDKKSKIGLRIALLMVVAALILAFVAFFTY